MPPAALMPFPGFICAFISATSSNVAPAVEKPVVYKYKSKKNYRRKQGHRQPYTKVEITKIG